MPQRPSRDNARNHKQRAQREHRTSPSLSPPAQLPTPLPDEQIPHFSQLLLPTSMEPPVAHQQSLGSPFGHEAPAETSSSRLIDFDTPPFQLTSLPAEGVNLDDQEEGDSGGALASTYRSPPFREAPLPNQIGSPPPLPIPPRIPYPQDYFEDEGPNDPVDVGLSGHVRSSAFSRYVLSFALFRFPFFSFYYSIWELPVARAVMNQGGSCVRGGLPFYLSSSLFSSSPACSRYSDGPIVRSTVLLFSYGGLPVPPDPITRDFTKVQPRSWMM